MSLIFVFALSSAHAVPKTSGDAGATPGKTTVRLYTNADLDRFPRVAGRGARITNAQLKEPLATQRRSIAVDPADWDVIHEWIDRERDYEARRRQQDLEYAAMLLAGAAAAPQAPRYAHTGFPYYFTGLPFDPGAPPVPVPSNPNASLRSRGIRTSVDLYRESVRDARIRHNSLP